MVAIEQKKGVNERLNVDANFPAIFTCKSYIALRGAGDGGIDTLRRD